ncbi:pimeloyl-ACP methyl esterase BioG family protein [Campylobacter sp. CX2-4080-23]|uniref:pimeloyl-ACP methyl esterase BioG family protein n=1 Tax=Campylobacter porcelli TaxID=1660073 RepID=UPI002EB04E81|nr:pimeloyl-ACP methyl esterase BioG family protein [Campylobacter sp. CX2-4080-23]
MKIDLIKDSKKLIVLFLGYGFDKSSISHLELGDYGLLVVSDYSDLRFDGGILANKDIYLISWSMGVWAANLALQNTPLKVAIAINGTPFGIDEKYGIKKDIFYKSISEFDFESFKKLCFLGINKQKFQNFTFNQNAKIEIINLYKNAILPCQNHILWDRAYVSKRDLIFDNRAVLAYFNDKAKIINAPHFAFFNFKSFGEIVEI